MVVFQAIASSGKVDGKVIEEERQVGEMPGMRVTPPSRNEREVSTGLADP